MTEQQRKIAYFDFDGTLVSKDSLWLFLKLSVPVVRLYVHVFVSLIKAALLKVVKPSLDFKTYVKENFLLLLKGMTIEESHEKALQLKQQLIWHDDIVAKLYELQKEGYEIVIITGALDVYISFLIEDLPVTRFYATSLEKIDNSLTGKIDGQNCVRQEKARIILAERNETIYSLAFGDNPSDRFMFAEVDQAYWVKGNQLTAVKK